MADFLKRLAFVALFGIVVTIIIGAGAKLAKPVLDVDCLTSTVTTTSGTYQRFVRYDAFEIDGRQLVREGDGSLWEFAPGRRRAQGSAINVADWLTKTGRKALAGCPAN